MSDFVVSARKYRPQTFDTVVGQKSGVYIFEQKQQSHSWNKFNKFSALIDRKGDFVDKNNYSYFLGRISISVPLFGPKSFMPAGTENLSR